jgi:hypothetical protein
VGVHYRGKKNNENISQKVHDGEIQIVLSIEDSFIHYKVRMLSSIILVVIIIGLVMMLKNTVQTTSTATLVTRRGPKFNMFELVDKRNNSAKRLVSSKMSKEEYEKLEKFCTSPRTQMGCDKAEKEIRCVVQSNVESAIYKIDLDCNSPGLDIIPLFDKSTEGWIA